MLLLCNILYYINGGRKKRKKKEKRRELKYFFFPLKGVNSRSDGSSANIPTIQTHSFKLKLRAVKLRSDAQSSINIILLLFVLCQPGDAPDSLRIPILNYY